MATYVDESELVAPYVDESELEGFGEPRKAEKPKAPPGGNILSYLLAAGLTGPSKLASNLFDLAGGADIALRKRLGLPTFGFEAPKVSERVETLQDIIGQGTLFPQQREKPFVERATQNVTGSLMFPGGVLSNVGASLTSDVVQETLKEAGAGQGAQAAGGIAAALPWAIRSPGQLSRTPQKMAEKSLLGYTDQQIKEAANLQKLALRERNPITAAQALGDRGRVLDLENIVMDSPFAPRRMLESAISQPAKSEKLAQKISGSLGRADTSLRRANEIEAVIEGALQFPTTAAGKAAAPYYRMLEATQPQLSVSDRFRLAADLAGIPDDVGLLTGSEAGRAAERVASTVTQPSSILAAPRGATVGQAAARAKSAQPFQLADPDIRKLDNYLKQVNEQVAGTYGPFATSAEKVERAGLVPGARAIGETIKESSPLLRRGKEVYQQTLERLEPAVRATGLREAVARPAMEEGAQKAAASWEKLENVLKRGNQEDVTRAFNLMSTQQGGAKSFTDITRTMLSRVFDKHFSGDTLTPTKAFSYAEELKKYPNIRRAVELSAGQLGISDPIGAASGFMKLLDIEQAAGRARGLPGGATLKEIEKYTAGKSGASLLFGHGLAKAATVVRNAQYLIHKAEMDRLSRVFDSPESLEMLVLLSKEKGPTRASQAIHKALLGLAQAEPGEEQ